VHKLQKLRDGRMDLPVMVPFARALKVSEMIQVARYIAALPNAIPKMLPVSNTLSKSRVSSKQDYVSNCAGCHGAEGQGNEVLLAPKLCGQHAQYLTRRMSEIERNNRGDADRGMVAILKGVNQQKREGIARWLATGQCEHQAETLKGGSTQKKESDNE